MPSPRSPRPPRPAGARTFGRITGSRITGIWGLVAAAATVSACGAVQVPAGHDASDPACAPIVQNAPESLLGQTRHETSSQGTIAWGSGADAIVLRCGVTPPGPTTQSCTRIADQGGTSVDWIVHEDDHGIVTFTTFGRTPAIDVTVPRAVAPDQPSAAVLDMTQAIAAIPATDHCVGPGDVG